MVSDRWLAVIQTKTFQVVVFNLPQAGGNAPSQSVASEIQGRQIGQIAQFRWNGPDKLIA